MPRIIKVTVYDPNWPHLYRQEARQIVNVLTDQVILIHHIGSTAIPGIKSKPIIDMLLEVRKIEIVDSFNEALIELGYEPHGENGIPERRYFVRRNSEIHSHHLHVFQTGNKQIDRHLDFRDYLRAHPDQAQVYSQLKELLAKKYIHDPVAYTEGKNEFIRTIDSCAELWREGNNAHIESTKYKRKKNI